MRSAIHRALALLSLVLVAQLAVLRGAMACDAGVMAASVTSAVAAVAAVDPHAAHAGHDAPAAASHHEGGAHDAGHLPGATCPAMTVCALVAMAPSADDAPAGRAAAERLAVGPASPRAWAPRTPEPPPPRG